MSVAGSVISATDLELFKNLANPAKVDIRQNPQLNRSSVPDIPPTTINGGENERYDDRKHSSPSRSKSRSRHSRSRSDHSSPPRHSRSRSHSRQDRPERRDSFPSSVPVSPPSSSHHSSPRPRPPKSSMRRHNSPRYRQSSPSRSRSHSRSRSNDEPRRSKRAESRQPPFASSGRIEHNPFRSSGDVIPAFYRKSPPRIQTSIFDQETQKYLRDDSPPPIPAPKLPYRDHGPSMSIPNAQARPRFFTPNPLDRPNLLDPVISPHKSRSKHSKSRRSRHSRSRKSRSRHSRSRRHRSRSRNNDDDEIAKQEKRKYLLDLEKLKLQGIRLTKDYTMNDSLADIRFEYDSHRSNYDVVDSINFMKDILGFSFTLIESLNQKFGPILQLRGWSAYMKNNMGRFDRLLERAYHRFWRQGQPSPFMEFGFLVFGSMIMWHLQNKYLNGLPVGEMLGVMGNGNNPPLAANMTNTSSANANASTGGNGGGNGFSLGNIMRMFTGGNANRPPPPQQTNVTTMPTIIPPVPSGPSQQSQQSQNSGNVSSIPVASRPVPPSGLAATLPPMNVRGIAQPTGASQNMQPANPSAGQPVRRMLRRPSAHLRDANSARAPLSPVQESMQENDIPTPP